ncbi:hypothetical protein, partial [Sphingomonas cynarae]|uniref:hypothetical protein n=1 Tax=Sphingomonas cynarae TaxID=930197 RepID=UPI0031D905F4
LTIRTARSRTSRENLFVVLLISNAPTHKWEPPGNPGRFTPAAGKQANVVMFVIPTSALFDARREMHLTRSRHD